MAFEPTREYFRDLAHLINSTAAEMAQDGLWSFHILFLIRLEKAAWVRAEHRKVLETKRIHAFCFQTYQTKGGFAADRLNEAFQRRYVAA